MMSAVLFICFVAVAAASSAALTVIAAKFLPVADRLLLVLCCGSAFPAVFIAYAFYTARTRLQGPPPNDAPGMFFVGAIMVAALITPVCLTASGIVIALKRRGD